MARLPAVPVARRVALRKESVDRNKISARGAAAKNTSLSVRRAWIEITYVIRLPRCQVVALRKESVDRNYPPVEPVKICVKSLSVRRAWIEIIVSR